MMTSGGWAGCLMGRATLSRICFSSDLASEGDDGADGLGEGLAGAGDRLFHAVEEAALRLLGFGGGGLVRFCGAFAEDGEGHAVSSLSDWTGMGFQVIGLCGGAGSVY